ncbi:hypothetical protein BLNAU_2995 [Blattamonas nauphoetae]|uniref:Uncharacterized protein n=1 Tax=Blattamonas nauphoetae TaxID=2049346 RepID=A0ABQ9YEC9_9EUKA|nr:hypothetical protein BLNAU_2995 [Blattamonas nauphoetae]
MAEERVGECFCVPHIRENQEDAHNRQNEENPSFRETVPSDQPAESAQHSVTHIHQSNQPSRQSLPHSACPRHFHHHCLLLFFHSSPPLSTSKQSD